MKKVIIGIRVDPDFKSEVQAEAKKRGVTLSDLLCECIGYGWQGIVEEAVKQSDNENSSPCDGIYHLTTYS